QPESFRKDRDVEKSVELWLSEIQKDSGKTMFLKNQHGDTNNFVIAWSTSFQLQVMVDNTDIACMDSTHKVVRKLHPAKDGTHVYPIVHWLTWLKDNCGFRTSGFMVDCSVVEHAGIKAVFTKCRLYYCSFHVAQIWERHLKSKGKVLESTILYVLRYMYREWIH
ncbi:hypothetical protein BGZ58_005122, partial [Dissophora ornata]